MHQGSPDACHQHTAPEFAMHMTWLGSLQLFTDGVSVIFWVAGFRLFGDLFQPLDSGAITGIFIAMVIVRLAIYLYAQAKLYTNGMHQEAIRQQAQQPTPVDRPNAPPITRTGVPPPTRLYIPFHMAGAPVRR
eukprot:767486-Hanusia_phi.AAC.3